eukprot:m51a1_g13422 putative ww domain-containing protein (198) ;mRNA; r:342-1607
MSKFKVTLCNFKATDLPAGDSNGLSDPYLRLNFDNYRRSKTDVVSKDSFVYETRFLDKLEAKTLEIECWDKDLIKKDDFLGKCSVTLHQLATGPVHQKLLLRDGTKPAGTVEFDAKMTHVCEVKVTFKSVRIDPGPLPPEALSLEYEFVPGGSPDASIQHPHPRGRSRPGVLSIEELDQLVLCAGVADMLTGSRAAA